MTMNESVKAAMITLGVNEGDSITEIRSQYLEKTMQNRFQRVILSDEGMKREFMDYYRAYVTLTNHYREEIDEDLGYYPPDQVFQFHFNHGVVYAIKQDYIKAGEKFQEAHRINNENVPVLLYLGVLLLKRKNYYAAEKYFKDAVRFDRNSDEGWFYLGECYFRAGELRKALNMYETSRNLWPGRMELAQRIMEVKENLPASEGGKTGKTSFFSRLFKKKNGK